MIKNKQAEGTNCHRTRKNTKMLEYGLVNLSNRIRSETDGVHEIINGNAGSWNMEKHQVNDKV